MKAHADYNFRPLIGAGVLLGIGMGGFLDGIVFHQLLQLHNMLSATLPKTSVANMEVNMFWDGLFHAFTWLTTMAGIVALWRAGKHAEVPWSTRAFAGSMLMGWGFFNLVEGVINHHLLGIHHVVERLGVSVFDYAFLASGVIFILAGWAAVRSGKHRDTEHAWHPGMTRKPA
jgi:uncharacterized membrane protein